jgi:hypothetical protein
MNRRKLNTMIKVLIPLGAPSSVLSIDDGEDPEAAALFFSMIYGQNTPLTVLEDRNIQ